jgi:serine/threonine protein kinase
MFTGGGYNEKVDIWAAGVLLYKIVTGRTPFESEYHSQTINNIMSSEINILPLFDKYSPHLKSLISKIFNKNPKERPSAIECLRDSWMSSLSYPHLLQHRGSFDL